MSAPRVLVHADRDELVAAVARRLLGTLDRLVRDSDRPIHVALTGGSVGIAVLAAVRALPARDGLDWGRVHLWWGDERWVPRGSADRNERQAREALVDALPIPAPNVHPFPAADDGIALEAAAERYAAELRAFAEDGLGFPRFALTLLGVGPDGHVASLFPDRPELKETEAAVIAVRESPKPPPERLSLALPVIRASERVWLVLAGQDKASALGLALAGASYLEVPAARAEGTLETVFWVDAAAAAEVPRELLDGEE